jgi:hypothetical protein
MTEALVLIDPSDDMVAMLADRPVRVLRTEAEIAAELATSTPGIWIVLSAGRLALRDRLVRQRGISRRVLCLSDASPQKLRLLNDLFQQVVSATNPVKLLAKEQVLEVLKADHPDHLFIGGYVDHDDQQVVLYRGNIEPLFVPFSWFTDYESPISPDFSDFEITDFGQTVRLGDYEAANTAVLYEFDAAFRAWDKKRQRALDDSLGGCIRRLRLSKGVKRHEFPPLNEKTIARIERGETPQPDERTLAVIAKRLGVRPDELHSY